MLKKIGLLLLIAASSGCASSPCRRFIYNEYGRLNICDYHDNGPKDGTGIDWCPEMFQCLGVDRLSPERFKK